MQALELGGFLFYMKKEDYIGKTYNRLTILNFENHKVYKDKNNKPRKVILVKCQCNCGNIWVGKLENLKSNNTLSCGCHKKENPGRKTHGLRNSSEYKTWAQIKCRCLNPNNPRYKDYGKRGINICDNWINSFENFLSDMGMKPSFKHSIDRIDNNLGYYKENCKWATTKEQNNNRRSNKMIEYKGKIQNLKSWCEELNLKYDIINQRMSKLKWTIEEAFETH